MTSVWKRIEHGWVELDEAGQEMGAVRTGEFGLAMLHQDQVWVDREGATHQLADMDVRYLFNVRRFLRRRARELEWRDGLVVVTSFWWPQGEIAQDDAERWLDDRMGDPEAWLETTPLLEKINELIGDAVITPITSAEEAW